MKTLSVVALAFLSNSLFAIETIRMSELDFSTNPSKMKAETIYFSFDLADSKELKKKAAIVSKIDFNSTLSISRSKILFNKIAYIANKPISYFNDANTYSLSYMQKRMPNNKISKIDSDSFKVTNGGAFGFTYQMDVESCYEDCQLNDYSKMQAYNTTNVMNSKYFILRDIHSFTKYSNQGINLTQHYRIDEKRTLVVTYNLSAVKRFFAIERIIYPNFVEETKEQIKMLF